MVLVDTSEKRQDSLFNGVIDTAEKFNGGVVNTGEQFFGDVVDTGDKFCTGVVDTAEPLNINSRISPRIFEKIQNGPNGILGGLRDTDL